MITSTRASTSQLSYLPYCNERIGRTDPVERDFFTANNGYTWEGTVALVYTSQICGSMPLYRLYAVNAVDHFYTSKFWHSTRRHKFHWNTYTCVLASATERAAALALGFVDQGIVAYVPEKGIVTGDSI